VSQFLLRLSPKGTVQRRGLPALCGTRDYRTLFESLKNLKVSDPILIGINALDESGDAISKKWTRNIIFLSSKFRILVTSRPENGIEAAFAKSVPVGTLYIGDGQPSGCLTN
jgi:hypothetical protein